MTTLEHERAELEAENSEESPRPVGWVPAGEIVKRYDCRTPGCQGEAKAPTGRNAFCLECRVRRGTALPDGTPLKTGGGQNAKATTKPATPRLDPPRVSDSPMPVVETANGRGRFESQAIQLVEAGRAVDEVLSRYAAIRPELEAALRVWREALAQLPHVTNGQAPAATELARSE